MKTLRYGFSVVVLVALAAGYFGSLWFAPQQWTSMVDTQPVVWLSLLVFIGAIVLCLLPADKESS
jgi:hypothetical protein